MASKRQDSFKIALDTLMEELRRGAHLAGARLTANEIAQRLVLSQTPVREALSRLAGEGLLLERRGQGFFVPELQDHDLEVLFRLHHHLLSIARESRSPSAPSLEMDRFVAPMAPDAGFERVVASERLFRALVASASPVLLRHLGRLLDQLAPVRRVEDQVLGQTAFELADLTQAVSARDFDRTGVLLGEFFERRIRAASQLIRAYGASKNIESI